MTPSNSVMISGSLTRTHRLTATSMTQVDDLNECLDKARSILTLNLTKGCHPQHKKQPSASQMDCSSNDFSLLACKGDTSTSTVQSICKLNVWHSLRNSMQLLAQMMSLRAGLNIYCNSLPKDFLRAGPAVNPWNKKQRCKQRSSYLFLRHEARHVPQPQMLLILD